MLLGRPWPGVRGSSQTCWARLCRAQAGLTGLDPLIDGVRLRPPKASPGGPPAIPAARSRVLGTWPWGSPSPR